MNFKFLIVLSNILLISCSWKQENLDKNSKNLIVGDFYGDIKQDTIFENYVHAETNEILPKVYDSLDWEKDLEMTISNLPICFLTFSDLEIKRLDISNKHYQKGIRLFQNLGDLNLDGKEDFGYYIHWSDFSNMNEYHVITIENKSVKKMFSFPIHERLSLDSVNLYQGKTLVKLNSKNKIIFKYYDYAESGEIRDSMLITNNYILK